jgi:hypothetical protein
MLGTIKASREPLRKERKGRMFVKGKINGLDTKMLLDTGAQANVIDAGEAIRLGIKVSRSEGCLQTASAQPIPILGTAKGVKLHFGEWQGATDFVVAKIDGDPIVLGIEFFDQCKAIPLPTTNRLLIDSEDSACMVATSREFSHGAKGLGSMRVFGAAETEWQGGLAKALWEERKAKLVVLAQQGSARRRQACDRSHKEGRGTMRGALARDFAINAELGSEAIAERKRHKPKSERNPHSKARRQRNEGVCGMSGGECHGPLLEGTRAATSASPSRGIPAGGYQPRDSSCRPPAAGFQLSPTSKARNDGYACGRQGMMGMHVGSMR